KSGRCSLPRPLDPASLYDALAELLDSRVQALAALAARGERVQPERRRRPRLAPDTEAPDYYARLRQGPPDGAVLIIDKGGAFRDHVARVVANTFSNTSSHPATIASCLAPGGSARPVEWTDSSRAAVRLCDETPVSLVMINTCAPGIEPYSLSSAIK